MALLKMILTHGNHGAIYVKPQYLIQNDMKQLLIPRKFRENYQSEFPLKDKPTKSTTVTGNTSRKRSRDADGTQEDQQPDKEAG